MLHDRHDALAAVLERVADAREYTLRIFRLDAALAEALPTLSSRVAELQQQAASATPGQRYLLERKLEAERRTELKRVGREMAAEAYDALTPLSVDAVREPLPAPQADGADAGEMVLNASFLVRRDATGDFQAAVATLARRHEAAGMRFEFTGPWPAYHFVREGR
jgi:urease accessory protein UreF